MIRSDPKPVSAQSNRPSTSSASTTSCSSRGGGGVGREVKEASGSSAREQHPTSSRGPAKETESVESDDDAKKVAGASKREEQQQEKIAVDQQVAKSSLDFGIDPAVEIVPSEKLSRCRQIILPPSTPIVSAPTSPQLPNAPTIYSYPSPLSSGRKLLDIFQTVVSRRPLEQQPKAAEELYLHLKTILEAPLMGYKFIVLGFTQIEILYAVQAAIAKLGGRYLLEKELEMTKSEKGESIDVDFVLVSNSLSLPLHNNTSPLARAINTRSLTILRPGDDIKLPSSSFSAPRRSEVLVSSAFFKEVVGICLRENASYLND